mgnify:CR=1 FL=1
MNIWLAIGDHHYFVALQVVAQDRAQVLGCPADLRLVAGAPLELMKARQRRFYFDQGGKLTEHFAIRAVPAVVEQQGRQLLITEQPPKPAATRPS